MLVLSVCSLSSQTFSTHAVLPTAGLTARSKAKRQLPDNSVSNSDVIADSACGYCTLQHKWHLQASVPLKLPRSLMSCNFACSSLEGLSY